MSEGAFGTAVYRDRGFVASLRDGRCPRLGTMDRALAVLGDWLTAGRDPRSTTRRTEIGSSLTAVETFSRMAMSVTISPSLRR